MEGAMIRVSEELSWELARMRKDSLLLAITIPAESYPNTIWVAHTYIALQYKGMKRRPLHAQTL
jgi:hypothetical protein